METVDMGVGSSEYAEVADMVRQLKTFDKQSPQYRRLRDKIVQRCLPIAENIAGKYRNRGEPLEDLKQTACIGLVNAVNRFDPDAGVDFLAFAVPTVMGEVRRHFRDYTWAIKVPRSVKDNQARVNRARSELSQQLGRPPNASEVAEHLGVDREQVVQAIIAGGNYSTLSTDVKSDEEDRTLGEQLGAVDPAYERVLNVETVRPLIAALPERERTVLTLRFFDEMTQTEIAKQIGCSQMHVSRILAQALHTLRTQAVDPRLAEAG